MNEIAATPIKRTTECQDERAKRDLAVYNDYNRLAADPTLPRSEINRYLMEKHRIYSAGTLYNMRKRAEERIKAQQQEEQP